MEKLLEKISSYNILNNLIPGAIFCWMCYSFIGFNFLTNSIIENIFIYYFSGMVISRIGSLVIEPICKKTRLVTYAPKEEYVAATQKDNLIGTLLEACNLYRTCAGLCLALILSKIYYHIKIHFIISSDVSWWILIIILLILFVFSYSKQSNHIYSRVKAAKLQQDNEKVDVQC